MSNINCEKHDTYELPDDDDEEGDGVDVEVEEGTLLDKDNEPIFCDAEGCEAHATNCVAVSVNKPHDNFRHYCECCAQVYMVGVQHGRHHEAARHQDKPGRDSSQEKPA